MAFCGESLVKNKLRLLAKLISLRVSRHYQERIPRLEEPRAGYRKERGTRIPAIGWQLVILPAETDVDRQVWGSTEIVLEEGIQELPVVVVHALGYTPARFRWVPEEEV